jgi:hypothetical protein
VLPGHASSRTTCHAAQGEYFGGLTRRSQEPGGVRVQGSNRSNSSMGFRVVSTTIHHPARGMGSRGTTYPRTQGEFRSTKGFTAPLEGRALEASRVHYVLPCMQLCSYNCTSILCLFFSIYPSCGQLFFSCLTTRLSCAILS